MRTTLRSLLTACCGLAASLAVAAPTAIEYYHSGYGHYFVTAEPTEIAALDAGRFAGWSRTGQAFGVLPLGTGGAASVCRFWSGQSFAPKSSHFYTPDAAECAATKGRPEWQYENEVFAVMLPDATGACARGTTYLYRLYNDGAGGAPNHRYTTSLALRSEMLAQGWLAEDVNTACVPLAIGDETISGRVVAADLKGAVVCLDTNRNGRCDQGEARAAADAAGAYRLTIRADATEPIVAEILSVPASASAAPPAAADILFRMASPSRLYAADITPYTTLVHLAAVKDYRLAEDLVRGVVGLPPRFDLKLPASAPAGSLQQSVAGWVVRALRANGAALDLAAPDALGTVARSFAIALTDLPQLRIATKNGASIDSREVYVDATYVLTNPAAAVTEVTLNGKIRGRGNTTWGQPKNPYKVQFSNDARYAAITDVLGMTKQRNWALLADWFDRSLIRNKLALSLASSSVFADGLKWNPAGQHVEVWLNGDYVGVYLLTEDIRIDPARLALKKMSSSPAAGDVDGGYIVEVDFRLDCYKGADLDLQLVTASDVPICIDTPDEEAITPAQLGYIKSLLVEVEADLYGARRLERLHLASFADWYLLQELFRNHDAAFISSDFMWTDTAAAASPADRLLNMGPVWDFDRSAGNVNYDEGWLAEGCWVSKRWQYNWFSKLFDDPGFVALTLARWQKKRPALEAFVNASIDAYARRLLVPANRNFQRWPILDQQLVNYYVFASHDEEVAFVRRFLNERMAWLDRAYASPAAFNAMCK
jgi:hypothetical protein